MDEQLAYPVREKGAALTPRGRDFVFTSDVGAALIQSLFEGLNGSLDGLMARLSTRVYPPPTVKDIDVILRMIPRILVVDTQSQSAQMGEARSFRLEDGRVVLEWFQTDPEASMDRDMVDMIARQAVEMAVTFYVNALPLNSVKPLNAMLS